MKNFNKLLISSIFSFGLLTSATANTVEETTFKRYEQAKLKLAYEGEVGDLLQLLSNRLNIGYLSHKTDPTKKIKITSDVPITVKNLIDNVQEQLPDMLIQFEKIGETVFITALNKQAPLKLKQDKFIGEAIFEEENNNENMETIKPKNGNQIEIILENEPTTKKEINEEKKP